MEDPLESFPHVRPFHKHARDKVEEDIWGRIVVRAISERASLPDFVDPVFCCSKLVTAAKFVEKRKPIHAHEDVETDLLMGKIALWYALRVDIFRHLVHDVMALFAANVVEDRVCHAIVVDIFGGTA
jgi:hypothetical protein